MVYCQGVRVEMTIAEMQLRDALVESRRLVQLAAAYERRAAEMSVDGLRSPRIDGQPCGSGPGMGVPRAVQLDAVREAARGARSQADIAARRARRLLVIAGYTGGMMVWADAYYCQGLTMVEAATLADRSPRQCDRYRREIMGSMPSL